MKKSTNEKKAMRSLILHRETIKILDNPLLLARVHGESGSQCMTCTTTSGYANSVGCETATC